MRFPTSIHNPLLAAAFLFSASGLLSQPAPLIPAMTSPSTPSGLVTCSGTYGTGYEGWRAFDGTNTLWLSDMDKYSVWLQYAWPVTQMKTVSSYKLTYANGSCCEERAPKNWVLLGWNGFQWLTLDTVSDQSGWYANPIRTFETDAQTPCSAYRLVVTADNYNRSFPIHLVSIASFQLFGSNAEPEALVPTMTGSNTPSGVVAASGTYGAGYEGWRAFDGTTSTIWLSNMDTTSVWLGYGWPNMEQVLVTSYKLSYANGPNCQERGPKNWTLQAFDGIQWVTVDTVNNQSGWYANPIRTFQVASPAAYRSYRLVVTADNYNLTPSIHLVSIASFQLFGLRVGAPAPVQ